MGLFKKFKEMAGGADEELVANGMPARGIVMGGELSGTAVTIGVEEHRVVDMAIQVFADGMSPYMVNVRQRIPEWMLANLAGMAVAMRIDPSDPSRAVVVLGEEPPVPTLAPPPDGGAAALLVSGVPAQAVIVSNQPLGVRNHEGHDVHLLQLTVMPEGQDPYSAQVGNAVPPKALPLLFPGARVHVRLDPSDGPNAVAVDWDAGVPT